MKKMLIGGIILSLMLLTAGLASAGKAPPTPFTMTTAQGALTFTDSQGNLTIDDEANSNIPTLTITQVEQSGTLLNLYHGALTVQTPQTAEYFYIQAVQGSDKVFHITGTDGSMVFVSAEGTLVNEKDPVTKLQTTGMALIGSVSSLLSFPESASYSFTGTLLVK